MYIAHCHMSLRPRTNLVHVPSAMVSYCAMSSKQCWVLFFYFFCFGVGGGGGDCSIPLQ